MNVCASEFEKMEKKWGNGKLIFEAPAWSSWKIPDKNCDSGVSPYGVFICTIAGNYNVLHATVVV